MKRITIFLLPLVFVLAAYAAECKDVAGEFFGTYDTVRQVADGRMVGDIDGHFVTRINESFDPLGNFAIMVGESEIQTERGTLLTLDQIVMFREPGTRTDTWNARLRVIGGTGDYEGATGVIYAKGKCYMETGRLTYEYEGTICPPGPRP